MSKNETRNNEIQTAEDIISMLARKEAEKVYAETKKTKPQIRRLAEDCYFGYRDHMPKIIKIIHDKYYIWFEKNRTKLINLMIPSEDGKLYIDTASRYFDNASDAFTYRISELAKNDPIMANEKTVINLTRKKALYYLDKIPVETSRDILLESVKEAFPDPDDSDKIFTCDSFRDYEKQWNIYLKMKVKKEEGEKEEDRWEHIKDSLSTSLPNYTIHNLDLYGNVVLGNFEMVTPGRYHKNKKADNRIAKTFKKNLKSYLEDNPEYLI